MHKISIGMIGVAACALRPQTQNGINEQAMATVNDIQNIVSNILVLQIWLPSIVSFFMCLVFVLLTPTLFTLFQRQEDANAVQSAHEKPTLRIGGLGLLIGILSSIVILNFTNDFVLYASLLLCSAIPLILAGFAEDIGYRVHPRYDWCQLRSHHSSVPLFYK